MEFSDVQILVIDLPLWAACSSYTWRRIGQKKQSLDAFGFFVMLSRCPVWCVACRGTKDLTAIHDTSSSVLSDASKCLNTLWWLFTA